MAEIATSGQPSEGVRRVKAALAAGGFEVNVRELAQGARSAEEAAAAIGCPVACIAKSIVFRGTHSDRPILVVASGPNRVREQLVEAVLEEPLARADAAWVRARTGFVIGGVAPLAHTEPPLAVVDRDLLAHRRVWAAAGHPRVVFEVDPCELERMTGGVVAAVS